MTRNLDKPFLAVGLKFKKKTPFVAAGSKEYLKMFIDFFTLNMAHYIKYGQPITPASFSYLVGIMLSLIRLH